MWRQGRNSIISKRESNTSLLSDHQDLDLNELAQLHIKSAEKIQEVSTERFDREFPINARSSSVRRLYGSEHGNSSGRMLSKISTLQKLKEIRQKRKSSIQLSQQSVENEVNGTRLQVSFRSAQNENLERIGLRGQLKSLYESKNKKPHPYPHIHRNQRAQQTGSSEDLKHIQVQGESQKRLIHNNSQIQTGSDAIRTPPLPHKLQLKTDGSRKTILVKMVANQPSSIRSKGAKTARISQDTGLKN